MSINEYIKVSEGKKIIRKFKAKKRITNNCKKDEIINMYVCVCMLVCAGVRVCMHMLSIRGVCIKIRVCVHDTSRGSSGSSTETDINTRLVKAWTAIDILSVVWKSDLTDKMKRCYFSSSGRVDTAVGMHFMDAN